MAGILAATFLKPFMLLVTYHPMLTQIKACWVCACLHPFIKSVFSPSALGTVSLSVLFSAH